MVAAATVVAARAAAHCLRRLSKLESDTRTLVRLSRTDPLTGLSNRRHLEASLTAAGSAARRHEQPLAVLFVDVDGFKRINDQLGYDAGDTVLRAVGERMRQSVRTEDLVARWGGEEFVVVLPATGLDGAVAAAERVRSSIASEQVDAAGRRARVTVSVGCASGVGDPAELVRGAGRALREAKRAGKNRVVAWSASGLGPDAP